MTLKDKIKKIKELIDIVPELDSLQLMKCDVNELVLLTKSEYVDTGINFYYRGVVTYKGAEITLYSETNSIPLKFVEFEKIEDRRNEKKEKFEIDATLNDGKVVKAVVERNVDFVYAGTIGDSSITNGLKDDYTPIESEWEFIELNAYDIDGDLLTLFDVQEWIYKEMIINKL